MDCHTISQCHLDGDLYVLKCKKLPFNFLYGTIAKNSSILRYLPKNYYDFEKGPEKTDQKDEMKRQKIIEKDIVFNKELLQPINDCGCFEQNVPMDNLDINDDQIISNNNLMEKIGEDIFFTPKFPVRMDLKQLNVVEISQIDAVLVSVFRELYGLPYLILGTQ